MEVGIVGLPQSGKTTVFNALTRGTAIVSSYASDGKPNVGVAKVSDRRLTALAEFFKSERTVMSEVTYFDLPARPGSDDGAGISGARLTHLQRAAALVLTVRAFENPSVPLPPRGVDCATRGRYETNSPSPISKCWSVAVRAWRKASKGQSRRRERV